MVLVMVQVVVLVEEEEEEDREGRVGRVDREVLDVDGESNQDLDKVWEGRNVHGGDSHLGLHRRHQ